MRPAYAAQGGALHPQGRKQCSFVVVGIFTSPHNQNSSESSLHAFAFSVRAEESCCLFSMCLLSAFYEIVETNKQA